MNSNNIIAATLYSLETVCLSNISINTLYKGDDDDNNRNNNNKSIYTSPLIDKQSSQTQLHFL